MVENQKRAGDTDLVQGNLLARVMSREKVAAIRISDQQVVERKVTSGGRFQGQQSDHRGTKDRGRDRAALVALIH